MDRIAVGAFHNLALLESGQVWSWGNNEYGQLGTGDTQPRSFPLEIKELSGLDLVRTIRLCSCRKFCSLHDQEIKLYGVDYRLTCQQGVGIPWL